MWYFGLSALALCPKTVVNVAALNTTEEDPDTQNAFADHQRGDGQ